MPFEKYRWDLHFCLFVFQNIKSRPSLNIIQSLRFSLTAILGWLHVVLASWPLIWWLFKNYDNAEKSDLHSLQSPRGHVVVMWELGSLFTPMVVCKWFAIMWSPCVVSPSGFPRKSLGKPTRKVPSHYHLPSHYWLPLFPRDWLKKVRYEI